MKSSPILDDPLNQPQWDSTNPTVQDIYTPTFGYNYDALSPWYSNGSGQPATLHVQSATAPEKPADLPMIMAKYSTHNLPNANPALTYEFFAQGAPNDWGPLLNTTIDSPDCYTINSLCVDNWGNNADGSNAWYGLLNGNVADGAATGGNSRHDANALIGAFVDGHAKKMAAGQWATGTNFGDTVDHANLVVNDPNSYKWWVHPGAGN